MLNRPEIVPSEITSWLDEQKHSREWLAEQTGTSVGTVANWLAPNKPRPIPAPTLKLIERLMSDDLLGQAEYSYADAKIIRRAMAEGGYHSLRLFARDAVIANAKRLLSLEEEASELRDPQEKRATVAFPMAPVDAAEPTLGRVVEMPPAHVPPPPGAGASTIRMAGAVAAGDPSAGHIDEAEVPVGKEYPSDHYAVSILGRSMEPKIREGSTVIVREYHDKELPKKGTIVIYSDGSGSTIKEFSYRKATPEDDPESVDKFGNVPVLRSLNPAFKDVQTMEGGRIDAVFVEAL